MEKKLEEIKGFLNETLDKGLAYERLIRLSNAELQVLVRDFSCYTHKRTKKGMVEALIEGIIGAKLRSYAIRNIDISTLKGDKYGKERTTKC